METRIPQLSRDPNTAIRQLLATLKQLAKGKANNGNRSFTLQVSVATTTVNDALVTARSHIAPCPLTAAAAAELASGNMFISQRNQGSFVVTHTNSATAGRTFSYSVQG